LAETGKYPEWSAIAFELRFVEGIKEARNWLAGLHPVLKTLS
jgi:hypothetical protein